MEKRLRLFHFSKDQYGEPYYSPGTIFDDSFEEFSKIVEDLDSRIIKCIDDKYAKKILQVSFKNQLDVDFKMIFI